MPLSNCYKSNLVGGGTTLMNLVNRTEKRGNMKHAHDNIGLPVNVLTVYTNTIHATICDDAQTFQESVSTLVSQVFELPLHNVSEKKFMLGLTSKSKTDQKLNTIIMHVKFYIYRQRLFHDNRLDSLEWFYEFKMYLLKER